MFIIKFTWRKNHDNIEITNFGWILSFKVILTLAVAVKELIENSIDAGASIIDVTLNEYGSESIVVCDNGEGVLENNFEALSMN